MLHLHKLIVMPKELADIEQVASHYLLAAIGKKVLRPGGKELTRVLIDSLQIGSDDQVLEFAPGQGFTTKMVLDKHPASYIGVELDPKHVQKLQQNIEAPLGTQVQFITGDAEATGLPEASADKIFGEAMLSMHADQRKARIVREASRVLKKGGLYAIHELELNLNPEQGEKHEEIQRDLAKVSHVNARPLTLAEWTALLEEAGLEVLSVSRRPLKVLDPSRIIADEGLLQTLRIGFNVLTMPKARKRVLAMRKAFKAHSKQLNALAILARKR
jgi:ubiquinone/menaquinone biosynthesis C-methylase UbiE